MNINIKSTEIFTVNTWSKLYLHTKLSQDVYYCYTSSVAIALLANAKLFWSDVQCVDVLACNGQFFQLTTSSLCI